MAQEKRYKLGEFEFKTEQEYREAATDLKRIKGITDKYNIADPEQARKILATVKTHPETFRSPFGRKFIEKLESAAGRGTAPVQGRSTLRAADSQGPDQDGKGKKEKAKKERIKKEKAAKKEKKTRQPSVRKTDGAQKEKFQIFTPRNFAVGVVIVACIVVFSVFAPRLFSFNNSGDSNGDIRRNMVTAYAKSQAELKAQLYTYYFNVVGETEEEADRDAQEGMGHYVLDLSDRTVSTMTDSEISDVYKQLSEGGDIQNNSFVEPAEITVLKDKLLAAGLSGNTGNGLEGETAVVAAVNSMMDYQERLFYSLSYCYSLLGYPKNDCEEYAAEDLGTMFGEVIYNYNMTEDEKQRYFDSFVKKGLIKDNQIVRFAADPAAYNLPDMTPVIEVSLMGAGSKAYQCSMISYAPAASVFYEIHSGKKTGYICFRNNGGNKKYIPLDDETSVTVQGDFFMLQGSEFTTGEWFYNRQNLGIRMNGDASSVISYVHDLAY